MLNRIVLVGASSGIGAALAVEMARNGRTLGLVARNRSALDDVAAKVQARGGGAIVETCDVTQDADSITSWARLRDAMGGIDAIVYASGVMPVVGADEFDPAKDRQIIETNVIGAMTWLDLAARDFASQGHGTICGIGSVAGDRGRKPGPAYGASKAALHTFLESLRNRLHHRGVRVVTIKPGPIDTPMARTAGRPAKSMYPVDKAARRIAKAIEGGEHTVYVPWIWWPIMTVIRSIPSFLFRKLSI